MKSLLLTGATGFLGAELLKRLLLDTDFIIYVIVRAPSKLAAEKRIIDLIKFKLNTLKVKSNFLKRVNVIRGDLTEINCGIVPHELQEVCSAINMVYHCAALTDLGMSEREAQENICGTKNLINLIMYCENLEKVIYIGTTFVAGNLVGDYCENDFNCRQSFNNNYEFSKYQSENLFRSIVNKKYATLIFRPSLLMGSYDTGIATFSNLLYKTLKIFSKEIFNVVPGDVAIVHNLIPVDLAAKAIFILSLKETKDNTYHIISSENVVMGNFIDMASRYFSYKNPQFIPIKNFDISALTPAQFMLLKNFIPYFNYRAVFKSGKTECALYRYNFKYPKIDTNYFFRIFDYCKKVGFIDSPN